MPEERMEVIVEEIRYWKRNQLLPEMYCDYLLALYTKGENGLNTDLNKGNKRASVSSSMSTSIQLILLLFMIPFSLLIIYVLPYIFIVKMLILMALIGYAGWTIRFFKFRDALYIHISMMVLFILILLSSIYISQYYESVKWVTTGIILCNLVVWLIAGMKTQITFLVVIGVFGIFMTIIYYFSTSYLISL